MTVSWSDQFYMTFYGEKASCWTVALDLMSVKVNLDSKTFMTTNVLAA